MDKESHLLRLILYFPDQMASLLGSPARGRVRCTACHSDASGSQLDEEQNIDRFEPDGLHGEEIANQNLIIVMRYQVKSSMEPMQTGAGSKLWRSSTLRIVAR